MSEPFVALINEATAAFLAAVDAVDARHAARILGTYISADPHVRDPGAGVRCRALSVAAPVVACGMFAKLYSLTPDDFCYFDASDLEGVSHGSADHAALQVITAHLNGDDVMAQALRKALYDSGGFDALVDLTISMLRICVDLKRRGAYVDAAGAQEKPSAM